MEIKQEKILAEGIKFVIKKDGKEVGRGFLYLMKNESHDLPFGLLEDIYVEEKYRGQGVGTELLNEMIKIAREKCYKLILTSRYSKPKVHELYLKLGFKDWGKEFRMDFIK